MMMSRLFNRLAAAPVLLVFFSAVRAHEMSIVPAGSFSMGDAYGEGDATERPVHTVAVSSFQMDRYEVSNAQVVEAMNWAETQGMVSFNNTGSSVYIYVGGQSILASSLSAGGIRHSTVDNRLSSAPGMADHPCVNINWYGALVYCNARSGMEQLEPCYDLSTWTCDFDKNGYRLPTEGEWEYAARGGLASHHFPWNSSGGSYTAHIDGSRANYRASGDPYSSTTPVGYYNGSQTPAGSDMANGYGLYDMAGNAAELCWDCYDANWYGNAASGAADTHGPAVSSVSGTVEERVVRPGSWNTPTSYLRCAARLYTTRATMYTTVGFRCARKFILSVTTPSIDQSNYYALRDQMISFGGGGSVSTSGENIEYRFDRGDPYRTEPWPAVYSPITSWWPADGANRYVTQHDWERAIAHDLRMQARTASGSCTSEWSDATTVWVTSMSVTDVTKDPDILFPSESLVFTPVASIVNLPTDGVVQWQADWGDGRVSGWVPQPTLTQSWPSVGTYYVRFRVRDGVHTELTSDWYPPTGFPEFVHVDVDRVKSPTLSGPAAGWGWLNDPYAFTATSDAVPGTTVEYRFNFGDGETPWSTQATVTNTWTTHAGTFSVMAQARVAGDASSETLWSFLPGGFRIENDLMVTIPDHTFVMGLEKPADTATMSDYFAAATSTHGQVLGNIITNDRFQARLDWIATARVDQVVWEPEVWNRAAEYADTPEERANILNVMSNVAGNLRASLLPRVGEMTYLDQSNQTALLTLNIGAARGVGFPPGFGNRLTVGPVGITNSSYVAEQAADAAAAVAQRIGESARAVFQEATLLAKQKIDEARAAIAAMDALGIPSAWAYFRNLRIIRLGLKRSTRTVKSSQASSSGGLRVMAEDSSAVGHDVRVSTFKMSRYEVSNAEMATVLQWAYDEGHVTVSSGWVVNTVGTQKNLVNVGNPDSQVRFSGGVFSAVAGKEDFPCILVTWHGAMAFCHYRTLMDPVGAVRLDLADWSCSFNRIGYGQTYRLPTEAEWEAAARGGLDFHGQPLTFVWTNVVCANPLLLDFFVVSNAANFANSGDPYEQLPDPQTTPCGYYAGSPCESSWIDPVVVTNGFLFDIIGNVEEWCYDYYTNSWYSEHAASFQDTTGPTQGVERVVRGGSWRSAENGAFGELRLGHRSGADPQSATDYRGFRYVKVWSGPPVMEYDPGDDGIPDPWERQYGQVSNLTGEANYDMDDMTDREEYLAGTNPMDPFSRLWVYQELITGDGDATAKDRDSRLVTQSETDYLLRLAWLSQTGRLYRVMQANDLSGAFTPVSGTIEGTGDVLAYTVNVDRAIAPQGMYRIRVSLPNP